MCERKLSSLKDTTKMESVAHVRHPISLVIWYHHFNLFSTTEHKCCKLRLEVWKVYKPGWMFFHCKCQWLSRPFLAQQSYYGDVSSQQLAFPMVGLPSWPYAISWSKPMVCVSIHVKNADGHGCASIQPIDHCNQRKKWKKSVNSNWRLSLLIFRRHSQTYFGISNNWSKSTPRKVNLRKARFFFWTSSTWLGEINKNTTRKQMKIGFYSIYPDEFIHILSFNCKLSSILLPFAISKWNHNLYKYVLWHSRK